MQEAIYKGATRPPILFGVPLVPGVLIGGAGILFVAYSLIFTRSIPVAAVAILLVAAAWTAMLLVTRKDDQRLMQLLLRLRLRQHRPSLRNWGAISYAPGAIRGMRGHRGKRSG